MTASASPQALLLQDFMSRIPALAEVGYQVEGAGDADGFSVLPRILDGGIQRDKGIEMQLGPGPRV